MQHSDALRVAMLMAGAPDVGPLPPARPLPAFSRAAAAVDEIGRMLSTLHASSPAISVTLESEQHVIQALLDTDASRLIGAATVALTAVGTSMAAIREDVAAALEAAPRQGLASVSTHWALSDGEWHVRSCASLAASVGCPLHEAAGLLSTGSCHVALAALGAVAAVEDLAGEAARWVERLHAARGRRAAQLVRRGALRGAASPAEVQRVRNRWRSSMATGPVADLRRRVCSRQQLAGSNAAPRGQCTRGPPADSQAGSPRLDPDAKPTQPQEHGVTSTSSGFAPTDLPAVEGGGPPLNLGMRAQAIVMERAAEVAELEALEAQAEQVAALTEVVAREVALQAEVVQRVEALADESADNTQAAKLHLLAATSSGPGFGRIVMTLLLGLAALLLLLHWISP